MKDYVIYFIKNRSLIKDLVELDPYNMLDYSLYNSLKVELDNLEKKAVIETKDLYVFIDYKKAFNLLQNQYLG